jgi:NodT family efflux transporter outer membrane factor (OMF) lipoprotein
MGHRGMRHGLAQSSAGLKIGRRMLAIFAAICLVVTACTVGPDYHRPIAVAPPVYKELPGWKVAQPQDEALRGAWWELFQDPQLNALEEQVNISNQNLAAAEAQVRQARAVIQAARASYFPTLSAGADVTRSRSSANVKSGPSTTLTQYNLPMDASWEPDLWGRVRRNVESQRANAEASLADLESVRLSAQATLAQSYFALRIQDTQRQLLEATVATYQRSLAITQNRYAVGVASRADVAQAETQLKSTQAQLMDVGVQRAQLEHAMAVLVGKPVATFSIPVAPLTTSPPAIPVGVPSELLERRPDIAGAERRMAAANAQIGVAKAAFYPNLTLSATLGFASIAAGNWASLASRVWALGAAISETVFDGGLRKAVSEEAMATYDATVASYRQTVLTAFQDVEDNLAALRILEDEARVQDEAVQAARQALTVVMNQYQAGTLGYLDVVVTQATALTNERGAVDIYGRRMIAAVLLIKAVGGGWNASTLREVSEHPGDASPGP